MFSEESEARAFRFATINERLEALPPMLIAGLVASSSSKVPWALVFLGSCKLGRLVSRCRTGDYSSGILK